MSHADSGSRPRRQWAPDARALGVVGDRWVMVIVRDLAAGPLRLDTLRRWLPGVSAGALDTRLKRMAEAGLLERRRHSALPPRVDLELTPRGHALAGTIAALARWELREGWSAPEEDEWIDVGACLRLAPFLAEPARRTTPGELELTVLDARSRPIDQYAYVHENGRARVRHGAASEPTASIEGTEKAWIAALGPQKDHSALSIAGDRAQATAFLKLFT